ARIDRGACCNVADAIALYFKATEPPGQKIQMGSEIAFRRSQVAPILLRKRVCAKRTPSRQEFGENVVFKRAVFVYRDQIANRGLEHIDTGVHQIELLR